LVVSFVPVHRLHNGALNIPDSPPSEENASLGHIKLEQTGFVRLANVAGSFNPASTPFRDQALGEILYRRDT
jgi:hypothetical protein